MERWEDPSFSDQQVNDLDTAKLALRWALSQIRTLQDSMVGLKGEIQDKSAQERVLRTRLSDAQQSVAEWKQKAAEWEHRRKEDVDQELVREHERLKEQLSQSSHGAQRWENEATGLAARLVELTQQLSALQAQKIQVQRFLDIERQARATDVELLDARLNQAREEERVRASAYWESQQRAWKAREAEMAQSLLVLEKDRNGIRSAAQDGSRALERTENEVRRLQGELDRLNRMQEESARASGALEKENRTQETARRELEARLTESRVEAAAQAEKVANLEAERAEWQKRREEENARRKALFADLGEMQARERKNAEDERSRLESEKRKLYDENAGMKQAVEAAAMREKGLEAQLVAALDEKKGAEELLSIEREEFIRELESFQQRMTEAIRQAEKRSELALVQARTAAQAEIDGMAARLRAAEQAAELRQARITETETFLAAAREAAREAEASAAHWKLEVEGERLSRAATESDLKAALQNTEAAMRQEHDTWRKEKEELDRSLQIEREGRRRGEAETARLLTVLQDAQRRAQGLGEEKAALSMTLEEERRLHAERSEKEKNALSASFNDRLAQEVRLADEERKKLAALRSEMEARLAGDEQEAAQLRARLLESDRSRQAALERISEQESALAAAQKEAHRWAARAAELEKASATFSAGLSAAEARLDHEHADKVLLEEKLEASRRAQAAAMESWTVELKAAQAALGASEAAAAKERSARDADHRSFAQEREAWAAQKQVLEQDLARSVQRDAEARFHAELSAQGLDQAQERWAAEKSALAAELGRAKEETAKLSDHLTARFQRELEALKGLLASAEADAKDKAHNLVEAQKAMETQRRDFLALEEAAIGRQKEIEERKRRSAELERDITAATEKLKAAEQAVEAMRTEYRLSETQGQQLREQLRRSLDEAGQLRHAAEAHAKRAEAFAAERDKAVAARVAGDESLAKVQGEVALLRDQTASLESQKSQAAQAWNLQHAALVDRLTEADGVVQVVRKKLSDLQSVFERTQNTVGEKQAEIEELKKAVERLRSALSQESRGRAADGAERLQEVERLTTKAEAAAQEAADWKIAAEGAEAARQSALTGLTKAEALLAERAAALAQLEAGSSEKDRRSQAERERIEKDFRAAAEALELSRSDAARWKRQAEGLESEVRAWSIRHAAMEKKVAEAAAAEQTRLTRTLELQSELDKTVEAERERQAERDRLAALLEQETRRRAAQEETDLNEIRRLAAEAKTAAQEAAEWKTAAETAEAGREAASARLAKEQSDREERAAELVRSQAEREQKEKRLSAEKERLEADLRNAVASLEEMRAESALLRTQIETLEAQKAQAARTDQLQHAALLERISEAEGAAQSRQKQLLELQSSLDRTEAALRDSQAELERLKPTAERLSAQLVQESSRRSAEEETRAKETQRLAAEANAAAHEAAKWRAAAEKAEAAREAASSRSAALEQRMTGLGQALDKERAAHAEALEDQRAQAARTVEDAGKRGALLLDEERQRAEAQARRLELQIRKLQEEKKSLEARMEAGERSVVAEIGAQRAKLEDASLEFKSREKALLQAEQSIERQKLWLEQEKAELEKRVREAEARFNAFEEESAREKERLKLLAEEASRGAAPSEGTHGPERPVDDVGVSQVDMAFGIAHQIRTPLAVLRNLAEVESARSWLGNERRRVIDAFVRGIERIDMCLDVMTEFCRPLTLKKRSCDVGEVLEKAVFLVGEHCTKKKIEVRVEKLTAVPKIAVDPDQLRTAFLHILFNAIEASPAESVISVSLRWDARARLATVSVRDTGPGLDVDSLREAVRPFYTTKAGALGMGIPVARKILRAHGGDLTLENAGVGEGAVASCIVKG